MAIAGDGSENEALLPCLSIIHTKVVPCHRECTKIEGSQKISLTETILTSAIVLNP